MIPSRSATNTDATNYRTDAAPRQLTLDESVGVSITSEGNSTTDWTLFIHSMKRLLYLSLINMGLYYMAVTNMLLSSLLTGFVVGSIHTGRRHVE